MPAGLAITLAGLTSVPFAAGYLAVCWVRSPGWAVRLIVPLALLAAVSLALYARWPHALAAIVLALPWAAPFAVLGSLFAGRPLNAATRMREAAVVAIAPLVLLLLESGVPAVVFADRVSESIVVSASTADVWEQVINIDPVRQSERSPVSRMRLPSVTAAMLDHPRLGATRTTTLEGNLSVAETVTDWLYGERVGLTVKPDTAHMTEREAFAVRGTAYEFEPMGDTATRVTMTTDFRTATHLNWYVVPRLTRLVAATQRNLLSVVKSRAEQAVRTHAAVLTADMREMEAYLMRRARAEQAGAPALTLLDEAVILTPDGAIEPLGGVSIPGSATPASVDASLRNVLQSAATRARATGWLRAFGGGNAAEASSLHFEFEDRAGRCVAMRLPAHVASGVLTVGTKELSRCEINALAEVNRRGRRLARIPFHDQGLGVVFTTVGDYPGTIDVYFDSVVVTVRGAIVQTKLLEGRTQHVDSVTASFGFHSGASWSPGKPSNAVRMHWLAREGETRSIPRLRFTILRDSADALTDRWIVFTHHLTVPKTADNPYGLAWTYAHLPDSIFKGVPGVK